MEMNSSCKNLLNAVAALSLLAGGVAYGTCFIEAEQFADRGEDEGRHPRRVDDPEAG